MDRNDKRPKHLGWIEAALQAANPDLLGLQISGQSHHGAFDRFAFVDVFGVDHDRTRRRKIRAEASDMLRRFGYAIEIEPGRDVYDLEPIRPTSAHDRLRMLQCLHAASDRGNQPDKL